MAGAILSGDPNRSALVPLAALLPSPALAGAAHATAAMAGGAVTAGLVWLGARRGRGSPLRRTRGPAGPAVEARPAPWRPPGAGPVAPRAPRSWELATADGCDAARCAAFLEDVAAMPRAAWLALGRRALAAADTAAEATADATAALDAVVAARRLGVTAWLVRDTVATAAHVAVVGCAAGGGRRLGAAPCSPAERAALAAARGAAERAALAELVRPWLRAADYRVLVAPVVAAGAAGWLGDA